MSCLSYLKLVSNLNVLLTVFFRFEYITHHKVRLVNLFTRVAIRVSVLIKETCNIKSRYEVVILGSWLTMKLLTLPL